MIPWKEIDRADILGCNQTITLKQRGKEFSIRTLDTELMNSRLNNSETALAKLSCQHICNRSDTSNLRVLIGGLGMGYTLAAALKYSKPDTCITVSEIIPAVVRWNRDYLGHLAGKPLDDPGVILKVEDVAETIGTEKSVWDAILLDVDNGPEGLTRKTNDRLYSQTGLKKSFLALRPGGILGIWSSGINDSFTRRLKKSGFQVDIQTVSARKSGKNSRHTIWLAHKPSGKTNR